MACSSMRSRVVTAHLLLLGVVLVWGATFSLAKAALGSVSPLLFNLLRMGLATAVLTAVNWRSLRGAFGRDARVALRWGAIAGFFLAVGYQFQTAGLARTTASKSAFITGLVVVLVPLFSAVPGVAARDAPRPGVAAFAGAGLAFAGLVLLTAGPEMRPGSGTALLSGLGVGEWLTLGCAVAFAGHLLTLARAAKVVPAGQLGTLQIGFCAVVLVVTLPMGGRPEFHWTPMVAVALGVTAVLGTAAAFTIQSWAQQILPASHTALILTLEPVFAWLTSMIFFGERMGARALAGAGLILGGILLAELAPSSRPTSPQSLVS